MAMLKDISVEAKEIEERTGVYIPPYRLTILMKAASQVADKILMIPSITCSYFEAELVLEIVEMAIKKAKGEQRNGST